MKEKIQIFITGVVPYLIICSTFYHIFFWIPFRVYILTVFSLNSLLFSIMIPLGASLAFTLIIFMGFFNVYQIVVQEIDFNDEKKLDQIHLKFRKFFLTVFTVCALVSLAHMIFKNDFTHAFLLLIVIMGLPTIIFSFLFAGNLVDLKELLNQKKVFMIVFMGLLLSSSIANGIWDSGRIIYNTRKVEYFIMAKEWQKKNNIISDTLKFVAVLPNKYVFITKDNKTVYIISDSEIPVLNLRANQ